jgi:seryl-tRNA synthetase
MINYGRLDRSIQFYENLGFQRIESPWTVTKQVSDITKPKDKKDLIIESKNKVLVASGEQSFLYLYLKGFLPKGKFQTVTPCFRDEAFDITHSKYFIKNELIITDVTDESELIKAVICCREFFEKELGEDVNVVKTNDGYDLECKDIELGSYGIRSCAFLDWIYATGLAEPRLSLVKNLIGK